MSSEPESQPEPTFEETLKRLETLVRDMETGRLGLDESLDRFEEGMKLVKTCESKLGDARKRVEMLMEKGEDELEWREVEEEGA